MADNDRWRNDQDAMRSRDEERRRREAESYPYRREESGGMSDRGRSWGDGSIAQRGFGNDRSGYDRNRRYGEERRGDFGSGGGDYDRGREERMGDRYGGGGAYGSDYRGGGMAGGRSGRASSGGYQDQAPGREVYGGHDDSRGSYGTDQGYGSGRGGDRDAAYRELHDRGDGYIGRDRNYGFSGGEGRGFWREAADEVRSWFSNDDSDHRREDRSYGSGGVEHHRGRGPRSYQRSDARILEDVNDRLTDDPHINASEIDVRVENREVTLSGTVTSRFEKRHAEDIAESVSGVTHVQNNIRVGQPGGNVGPIGAAASTTTGMSMEAGMPTGAASTDQSSGRGGSAGASTAAETSGGISGPNTSRRKGGSTI